MDRGLNPKRGSPFGHCIAIGSGGNYALAAARALLAFSQLDAVTIATESLRIASGIDIYTNDALVVQALAPLEDQG